MLTFTMAEEMCRKEEMDSRLPSVHSLAEMIFLVELGQRAGWFGFKRGVYLGGRLVGGNVIWIDGSKTDFTFWRDEFYPLAHKNCLAIFSTLHWQDTSCQVDSERGMLIEDFIICKTRINKPGLNLFLKSNSTK